MKQRLSSFKIPGWMKRLGVVGVLLLALFGLMVSTMVPLDAWLFRHREGGVPDWLDRAQSPLFSWLNGHSVWAQRFFAWQSRQAGLNAPDAPPILPLNLKASTVHPNQDAESRVGAIERYMADPAPDPRGQPRQKPSGR